MDDVELRHGERLLMLRFLCGNAVLLATRLFSCVAILGLLGSCSSPVLKEEQAHDILLITVDTARADRYSYTGSDLVDTAVADALAAEGTAFLSAFAPSPITLVSHASLLTGVDPPTHGVRNNGEFALSAEAETLAEVLSDQGWETAAFLGAVVLDSRYGLDQGFSEYDDAIDADDAGGMFAYARRRGDDVVGAALKWLEGRESRRTFVWVHLYDPHAPYLAPEPERSRYPDGPYEGAIAYSDRVVGRLLEGYRRLQKYDRTLVVLTSDHGESLGEHGENTHGVFVYDETIEIPLIMRGPGVSPGRRIDEAVRLIDVMPTILSLVHTQVPTGVEGRDLSVLTEERITEDGTEAPAVYIESLLPQLSYGWSPLRGVRTSRWKLIEGTGLELYDLETDPAEADNVAEQRPEIRDRLLEDLHSRLSEGSSATSERLAIDDATRRQLAALGYFPLEAVAADGGALPDPRTQIQILERMNSALNRFARGESERAIADLEAIVKEDASNLAAIYNLGQLKFRIADYVGAAEAYNRAADLAPSDAKYREFEGFALERAGSLEEALRAFDTALAVDPDRRGSRALRWRTLARLGRSRELIADLERVLAKDPSDGVARVQLLRTIHGRKISPQLLEALEQALAEYPQEPAIMSALAHALLGGGDEARVEDLYRGVLEVLPGDHDASLVLGRLALSRGEFEEGRRILEAGARKHPDRPAMQVAVARARLATGDLQAARGALSRAHRLDPESANLWLVSGELHIAVGDVDRAVSDLEKAAARRSPDLDHQQRLDAAFLRIGIDRSGN